MSIERESVNTDSMMNAILGISQDMLTSDNEEDKVYVNDMFTQMVNTFIAQSSSNNIESFKKYVDDNRDDFDAVCNDVQFKYKTPLNIYKADTSDGVVQVNPNNAIAEMSSSMMMPGMENFMSSTMTDSWVELIGGTEVISSQYDIIHGRLPVEKDEVVLLVDNNNEINELVLYGLGIRDQKDFTSNLMDAISNSQEVQTTQDVYTFEEICNMRFKLVLNSDYMQKDEKTGLWKDMSSNPAYVKKLVDEGMEIRIVGILKPAEDNVISIGTGGIGYISALMEYALEGTEKSQVVQEQLANPGRDVITGMEFINMTVNDFDLKDIDMSLIDMAYLDISPFMDMVKDIDITKIDITDLSSLFDFGSLSNLEKKLMEGYLSDEQVLALKRAYIDTINAQCSYENTLEILGYQDKNIPTSIYFYPKSFEAKDELNAMIDFYNEKVTAEGHSEYTISPTDPIGALLTSVTKVIDIVTYVLIVFIAISLVVSSIMIGIITYISVLERTKEIGILRSIGASKSDISRVFNAETISIGLTAGVLGILCTLVIEIPINMLLEYLTHTGAAAQLPVNSAVILVCISVFLTFISGLIPAKFAADKDPVEALRTE